eukprot:2707706-Rhodomonas_salina.1
MPASHRIASQYRALSRSHNCTALFLSYTRRSTARPLAAVLPYPRLGTELAASQYHPTTNGAQIRLTPQS